jgi:4-hydroxyphenylacetate 3-monooxygenase/chlorophenol-4-monooxygenase component 2
MAREEMSASGFYGKYASKVCGIEVAGDDMTAYAATADYAKAQDKGQRPVPALDTAAAR